MRTLRWILARLQGPHASRTVVLVAVLFTLPSLFSGLFIDEYVQSARWRGSLGSFLNGCFVFGGGTPEGNRRELLQDLGAWWTAPDFKVAFWRPVSAATHAVDLLLWPKSPVLMHVHSMLWFLGLLFAANALYRRLHVPRVAGLALALYAWDDARGQVLSWIAKRNALIAATFGVCALIAFDKWRRDGWRAGAWLAPLLCAVGLLSGEMAIATMAFLFAYVLFLDTGSYRSRAARLLPYLAVVTAWRAVYVALGFGVEATTAYTDPLRHPLAYAANVIQGAPILALGQLTPLASDFSGLYPPAVKVAFVAASVLALGILARMVRTRVAAEPTLRFWLLAAGLSLFPICATAPQDQNLVFVGLAAAPALGTVLVGIADDPAAGRWHKWLFGMLAVSNLAVALVFLPIKCLTILGMGYGIGRTDQSIPHDASVTEKTLVVPWVMSEGGVYATWNRRIADGVPRPKNARILSTSMGSVSISRLDLVTLRIRAHQGFLDQEMQRVMRPLSRPFRAGDTVDLSDIMAEVTEITVDGRPKTVEFRFATPLESPEWLWMRGQGFGLSDWAPPPVGESITIEAGL